MEQLDPEMLKNLDLLVDYEEAEAADDWEAIENIDEANPENSTDEAIQGESK